MTLSTKAFFFIICVLLISHSLTAMKRKTICGRTRGGKVARTSNRQNPTQCNHVSDEVWLPHDLWVSIAVQDLSNLKALQQTNRHINNGLKTITLDYLKNRIAENPAIARGIAKNFYICTNLLFAYGKELNETAFNTLWNNQPINDKGIRKHFVNTLASTVTGRKVTPLHVFNVKNVSLSSKQPENHHYEAMALFCYLDNALWRNNPQCIQLASTFLFSEEKKYNKSNKSFASDASNRYSGQSILRKACQYSNVKCLQMILDLFGHAIAEPTIEINQKKECLLHHILDESLDINKRAQKIELIIQYYGKTRADKEFSQQYNIVNHQAACGTPLAYAIDLFYDRKIFLDELINIITILLRYGAKPKIRISKTNNLSPYAKGYTVFKMIDEYTKSTNEEPEFITQEEAHIIKQLLHNGGKIITD